MEIIDVLQKSFDGDCIVEDYIDDSAKEYADPSLYSATITYYVCSTKDNGETANGVVMFSGDDMELLTEAITKDQTSVCYNIMIRKKECYRKCVNITSSSIKDDQDTVIIGFKITSKDKTCASLIYNKIKDYYKGASKKVRVIMEE